VLTRYVDFSEETVDRHGLWSIPKIPARQTPSQFRDDDELSVASTAASLDGMPARQTSSAYFTEAQRASLEFDDAFNRRARCVSGVLAKHRIIGKGNSGVVWAGSWVSTEGIGEKTKLVAVAVAVKVVPLPEEEDGRQLLVQEARVHLNMVHAKIVRCHEVSVDQGTFSSVMELMDAGSLLDNLKMAGDKTITYPALAYVGKSMLEALAHLHDEALVVHRDIKPGNILLSHDGRIKLSDFGICARVGKDMTEWIGTVSYMSPERIMGDDCSAKADIWSLGLVIAEAALGRYPFTNEDETCSLEFWDLLHLVNEGPSLADILAERGGDAEASGLVRICTEKDVDDRASAAEALKHIFVSSVEEDVGREALKSWVGSVWLGTCGVQRGGVETANSSAASLVSGGGKLVAVAQTAGGKSASSAKPVETSAVQCEVPEILGKSPLDKQSRMSEQLTVFLSALLR
jgi:hypothetical protein